MNRMKRWGLFGVLLLLLVSACQKEETLYQRLSPKQTGINFTNEITESDSLNILVTELM